MPPKVIFTKEKIIEAACQVAELKGIDALSARIIAKQLQSSTAPVYSCFDSMEELKEAVKNKAIDLLLDYQRRSYTDYIFLNINVGFVLFARDHQEFFRSIFMGRDDFRGINSEFLESIRDEMEKDASLSSLSQDERDWLLYKMWIFTHGFAALVCVGEIETTSREFIIDMLTDVATGMIESAVTNVKK